MAQENATTVQAQGIISWFVHNPVAANLLMLVILFAGAMTAINLKVEGFPSIPPSIVSIDIRYESGDALQAERSIAVKIEEALTSVKGIKTITSTSTDSDVNIQVEAKSEYPLNNLSTDIKNVVDGINSLPVDAEKAIITHQQWDESAIWLTISTSAEDSVSTRANLQQLTRTLESELLALPGINNVTRVGWQQPELTVEVDEHILQAHSLSLQAIADILQQQSVTATSGELRSADKNILLKSDKQHFYQSELAEIPVKTYDDGSVLLLKDIARVSDGFAETPNVLARFQGNPAINLEIKIDRETNIVNTSREVHTLVDGWRAMQKVPETMSLHVWMDQSINMKERLGLILENGLIGILLVMLVLSVFLNVKVAFWVGMGLPICFAGGLILMGGSFYDLTLNQISTFGFVLVLGILVDDAVIVGESIHTTHQTHGVTSESTVLGVNQVAIPTMYGVLTTVAAFYPLSLVDGQLGQLFSQFALVCTACLLFSMLESKLILPAHLAPSSKRAAKHLVTNKASVKQHSGKQMSNFLNLTKLQSWANECVIKLNNNVYQPILAKTLKYRLATLSLFCATFILVVGMVPAGKVGFSFFPDIPEETIRIQFSSVPGAGYGVVHNKVRDIEAVVSHLNQHWKSTQKANTEVFEHIFAAVEDDRNGAVTLSLSTSQSRQLSTLEIAEALETALPKTEAIQEIVVSVEDEDDRDFVVTFLSNDPAQLQAISERALQFVSAREGVLDPVSSLERGQEQIRFELTPSGRALGLTVEALSSQLESAFYGAEVNRIQRGKDEVRIRVIYPIEQRNDIIDLQQARVRTPHGQVVALDTVASFSREYVISKISRKDGYRKASISANVDESVISADDVHHHLYKALSNDLATLYPDVKVIKDGDAAEEEESFASLIQIFMFSAFLIYVLVAIPLKSYWQPLVIMSVVPFGIVGAILGHWFMDIAISILSINGILALSGVVVNDSLLLVNQYNRLRQEGITHHQALLKSGSLRLRAIILTSITTVLGLLSLLSETSEQAQFLIPAATSLAFGITFATGITLILVPVVLSISYDFKEKLSQLLVQIQYVAVRRSFKRTA